MRVETEDNARLVWLLGNYVGGQAAMYWKRKRLRVARELLGVETANGIWTRVLHWRGRCLENGIDPGTSEVVDPELFTAAWDRVEAQFNEARARRGSRTREQIAARNEALANYQRPPPPAAEPEQPKAVFKLPRY